MTDDNGNCNDIVVRIEEMGNEWKNIYVDTRYYLNQRKEAKCHWIIGLEAGQRCVSVSIVKVLVGWLTSNGFRFSD